MCVCVPPPPPPPASTLSQILWTFSIYLESVAVMPQLYMITKTGEAETITSHYLFALGSYRALYIINWGFRFYMEEYYDLIAIVAGCVQTALYCDFFYLYITKGRGAISSGYEFVEKQIGLGRHHSALYIPHPTNPPLQREVMKVCVMRVWLEGCSEHSLSRGCLCFAGPSVNISLPCRMLRLSSGLGGASQLPTIICIMWYYTSFHSPLLSFLSSFPFLPIPLPSLSLFSSFLFLFSPFSLPPLSSSSFIPPPFLDFPLFLSPLPIYLPPPPLPISSLCSYKGQRAETSSIDRTRTQYYSNIILGYKIFGREWHVLCGDIIE